MSTDTRTHSTSHQGGGARPPSDLLVVGTFGGGGIHQYIDEQTDRLATDFSVRTYAMDTPEAGSGVVWFLTAFLRALWAAVKFPFRPRPDVVHVHTSHRFSFYRASVYTLVAAYLWRRPVILHVHGSSFDEFAATDARSVRWLQGLVFGAADRVVVLSEYWRDVLTPQVPASKVVVLPNAVDPTAYDPDFGDDPPHVVFVSNLIERKGVGELVTALDALLDRDVDVRASIAGKGPLADRVEALAAGTDRVESLGYVSEERKRALLNEGAIFVLPTHAEGLPIAMLEGMAGGNAIVSTTVGSIPEVITDDNGVLVDPGDPDALADALARLVRDTDATAGMAARNRTLIEERYSWDRTTAELQRLYAREYQRHRGTG